MTPRDGSVVLGLLVLALASWAVVNSASNRATADPPQAGASPQQPIAVSLVQLIAKPEAFDGKYVQVQGFVCIEHEGTAIYLHREDAEHMLTRNGLWLAVNDAAPAGSSEAMVKDRYALIEGRFNAQSKGHRGLWSGAIENVTRMQPWEIRKANK
jgi:hypothetical protein